MTKREKVPVTLEIHSLTCSSTNEKPVAVKWKRTKDQKGSTSFGKIPDSGTLLLNACFTIYCKFIQKDKSQWKHKNVAIELVDVESTLHKWKLNIAELGSRDRMDTELKCTAGDLGDVVLKVSVVRGVFAAEIDVKESSPKKFAVPDNVFRMRPGQRRISVDMVKLSPPITTTLASSPIAVKDPSPTLGLGKMLRLSKQGATEPAGIRRIMERKSECEKIDEECQKLVRGEFEYIDGVPAFAINVVKNLEEGKEILAMGIVCRHLNLVSKISIAGAKYCFYSACFIYDLLRSQGVAVAVRMKVRNKMDSLFDNFTKRICEKYGAKLAQFDQEAIQEVKTLPVCRKDNEILKYISYVVLFAVAVAMQPMVGRQLILEFDLCNAEWLDSSVLHADQDEEQKMLMSRMASEKYCHTLLATMPEL